MISPRCLIKTQTQTASKMSLYKIHPLRYNMYCYRAAKWAVSYGYAGPVRLSAVNHVRLGTEQH